MTATICIRYSDHCAVYTDGVAYDKDVVYRTPSCKSALYVHLPAIVSWRGSLARYLTFINDENECFSFDHLVEVLPGQMYLAAKDIIEAGHEVNMAMILGGYSERNERLESYRVAMWDDGTGTLSEESLEVEPLPQFHAEPWPSDEALERSGLRDASGILQIGTSEDAVRFMQAQRETMYPAFPPPSTEEACIVGAFIQETKLWRDHYGHQKIIHRWPDPIGERLDPLRK